MTGITRDTLDELYNGQGLSISQIAKKLGCSRTTVWKWMEKHDLPRRPPCIWNKTNLEAVAQIAARYGASREMLDDLYNQQGLTLRQIGAQFGVTDGTILYWMKRHNLLRRDKSEALRYYSINEAAFDPPLTNEQAYWLGFLMADGCIDDDHVIGLTLKQSDQAHIELFRDFLASTHPIRSYKRHGKYSESYLFVASARLCAALKRYGVTPRKSHTASAPPELRENAHFWRGMVDGDGVLYVSGNTEYIGLYGSWDITHQFAAYVRSLTDTKANVCASGSSIYAFRVGGRYAVAVTAALYGVPGPALLRKQIIAHEFLRARSV